MGRPWEADVGGETGGGGVSIIDWCLLSCFRWSNSRSFGTRY
jgi:hypothetical protein